MQRFHFNLRLSFSRIFKSSATRPASAGAKEWGCGGRNFGAPDGSAPTKELAYFKQTHCKIPCTGHQHFFLLLSCSKQESNQRILPETFGFDPGSGSPCLMFAQCQKSHVHRTCISPPEPFRSQSLMDMRPHGIQRFGY